MEANLPALRRNLTANIKNMLKEVFFNFQNLIQKSFHDKLAAFQ